MTTTGQPAIAPVAGLQPSNGVILPIARRVMPSVILSNIIGVAPLTGPMRTSHNTRHVNAGIYRHFHRLNNRRKTQNCHLLGLAGYPMVKIDYPEVLAADYWCKCNLKPHSYIRLQGNHTFWFSRHEDEVLFRMRFT